MDFKKICYLLSLLISVNAFSQAPALPSITPVSPTAAALQKFGDYPVSLYTGLPDITIPVYTIETGGIKVPISLKYHASGIRYDDESRELGVGWTLFAGGMITKMQMGAEDYGSGFFKNAYSIDPTADGSTSVNDHHSMIDVVYNGMDSEYDIYNFSFLDQSGKFFYPGTTDPVLVPKSNLKINNSSAFVITDEDGVSYNFNGAYEVPVFGTTTANYLLGTITSADGSHTVVYHYSSHDTTSGGNYFSRRLVLDDKKEVVDQYTVIGSFTSYTASPTSVHHYFEEYQYHRLDSITFNEGSVVFNYNSNKLTRVKIYNKVDVNPVKVISLTQSSYGSDYYKLDEVKFHDSGATKSYSYTFGYSSAPYDKLSGIDYFGYYTGSSTTIYDDYIPNFNILVDGSSTALGGSTNRASVESAMLHGMLTRITYPTGGYSDFEYEAHRYSSGTIAGGLRIKSISNYDAASNLLGKKWYKYGSGESGDGRLYRGSVNPNDFCYTYLYGNTGGDPLSFMYTYRQRVYRPFPMFSYMSGSGSSVVYNYVTEYNGDGTNANGKTIYQYEDYGDSFSGPTINGPIPLLYRSNSWKTGQLKEKTVYKYESSSYTPVYSLVNSYTDRATQAYNCLKVMPYLNWPETWYSNLNSFSYSYIMEYFQYGPSHPVVDLGLTSTFSYADYLLSTGLHVLTSSVETRDGVSKTTTYNTYDSTYDKLKEEEVTQSDGSTRIIQYNYPFDYGSSTYTGMVAANIINPVIEQKEYKNSTSSPLQYTKNEYDHWFGAFYKPYLIQTSTYGGSYENRIRYHTLDTEGNVLTVSKQDGPKITYLWSYGGAYPVAEIENADYSTVETAVGGSGSVSTLRSSNPLSMSALESLTGSIRSISGALVTTYTYDPLVGVTSMKDPKGQLTTYEYDELNRLKNVKDQNGNIVKSYEYNYKH